MCVSSTSLSYLLPVISSPHVSHLSSQLEKSSWQSRGNPVTAACPLTVNTSEGSQLFFFTIPQTVGLQVQPVWLSRNYLQDHNEYLPIHLNEKSVALQENVGAVF